MNSIQLPYVSSHPNLLIQTHEPGAALHGWKDIASELKRGVRTVQRWERSLALPVHRIGDGNRSPVFAFKDELHFWLRKRADPHACAPQRIQEQNIASRTLKRFRTATLVKNARASPRRVPKQRNLRAILNLLTGASSRQLPGKCEQCHSLLRIMEAHFGISGTEPDLTIPVIFCPVCDLKTIVHLGAKQSINPNRIQAAPRPA